MNIRRRSAWSRCGRLEGIAASRPHPGSPRPSCRSTYRAAPHFGPVRPARRNTGTPGVWFGLACIFSESLSCELDVYRSDIVCSIFDCFSPATVEIVAENLAYDERGKQSAALTSLVAAIGLTALKLIVGLLTGSLGILAEAAHSGLDLVAAVMTF